MTPLVTIICTVYNEEKYLQKALNSILEQNTDFPYEILVVDDASSDSSPRIIESFRNEHPNVVRVITHKENQGIAATWCEACLEARGTYIARIDDDDYWIDENKLKEQVALLEASEDSLWCCTDFNMVDNNDAILYECVTANGIFPTFNTEDNYENTLAIKGAVASSTWMVDAELIREVNRGLKKGTADEAFYIELELFQKTRLSRINKPMSALRMNLGSGSRPLSIEDAEKRFEGLKQQQIAFLDKYPNADLRQIAVYLFDFDMLKDLEAFKRDREIERLHGVISDMSAEINQLQADYKHLKERPRRIAAMPARLARAAYHRVIRRGQ